MSYFGNPYLNLFTNVGASSSPRGRKILGELNAPNIHLAELKRLCFKGIPPELSPLRPIIWKLLFGYLPAFVRGWEETLETQQRAYEEIRQAAITHPSLKDDDHPLCNEQSSKWHIYFQDQRMWDSIVKDVKRTKSHLKFFFTPTSQQGCFVGLRPFVTVSKDLIDCITDIDSKDCMMNDQIEKHADVLVRILFVYSKLEGKYVQGMNEILAVIYYLFVNEEPCLGSAEAAAYYCFSKAMEKIKNNFEEELDYSSDGIAGHLDKLSKLVAVYVPRVHQVLEDLSISPFHYGVKWVVLLMAQELRISDVFLLWDALWSDSQPFDFLYYVCMIIVLKNENALIKDDYSEVLHVLQHPNIDDFQEILYEARLVYENDKASIIC